MLKSLELRRQLFHACLGIALTLLLFYGIFTATHLFVILVIGIILALLSKQYRIPIIAKFLDIFERDNVKTDLPGKGAIYFFVGALLAIKLFPMDIALASIMILALGDSISHIVGKNYGKTQLWINKHNDKLFEGTVAGIILGFFGAYGFVGPVLAFFGAAFAMTAELVEMKLGEAIIDDNILIPLVSGTVMLLLRVYF